MSVSMSKEEFVRIMSLPEAERAIADRFSWVGLLQDLQGREEPFTKNDVVKEFKQPANYVYSHLRNWVIEGKLEMVKGPGGVNYYLAPGQIE